MMLQFQRHVALPSPSPSSPSLDASLSPPMTFCLQVGDVERQDRERERGREGGREREMPRWIDRQMQRGRNLELQYSAYSSRIFPSCGDDDNDDDRRRWTWVNRGKRSLLITSQQSSDTSAFKKRVHR